MNCPTCRGSGVIDAAEYILKNGCPRSIACDPNQPCPGCPEVDPYRDISGREWATIVAGLRFWQREGLHCGGGEHEIATDLGVYVPLTAEEIDSLCVKINMR